MNKKRFEVTFREDDHSYWVDGERVIFSVTEILEKAGLIDYGFLPNREYHLGLGKAIHAATQYDDMGVLDENSVHELVRGYLAGWRLFKTERKPNFFDIEEPLYSPKLKVAGTPDRICAVDGKLAVLDIKKGKPQAGAEQTAFYQMIYNEGAISPIRRRMSVILGKAGEYKIEEYTDDFDLVVAKSAYNVVLRKEKIR